MLQKLKCKKMECGIQDFPLESHLMATSPLHHVDQDVIIQILRFVGAHDLETGWKCTECNPYWSNWYCYQCQRESGFLGSAYMRAYQEVATAWQLLADYGTRRVGWFRCRMATAGQLPSVEASTAA